MDFSSTLELKLVSKFEINRITRKLIRAILRFRSSFLPPKRSQNNGSTANKHSAEKHSAEKRKAHKHSAEKHAAKKQLRKISIQQ